jgi:hypothetical protein
MPLPKLKAKCAKCKTPHEFEVSVAMTCIKKGTQRLIGSFSCCGKTQTAAKQRKWELK